MKPEIRTTEDGSHTLFVKNLGEPYHSLHGALTESNHVFITNGFLYHQKKTMTVLEVGFGTGLNCLLTAIEAANRKIKVNYIGIEKFPLDKEIIDKLNYPALIGNSQELWLKIHSAIWNRKTPVSDFFNLLKLELDITKLKLPELTKFDVIYFDAFGPEVQPEMWETGIFKLIFNNCYPQAVFSTYSAKGEVRRRLISVGFKMEKISGPPGKKEMLRGIKTD
jgi:tRNA U34 5-methylaminomethyl-2-thiouridine-forming methyltransferase MnmC